MAAGASYIEYEDLDFIAGKIDHEVAAADAGPYHHYSFSGCSFLSHGAHFIYDPWNSHDISFDGCEFAYGGNGIYVIVHRGTLEHIYVSNSYFHDIGSPFTDGDSDGHAIGIQNNQHFYIRGNRFERCGSTVDFHVGGAMTQRHCHVFGNIVRDMRVDYGRCARGAGIGFEGDNDCPKGNTGDMRIAYNIIADTEGPGIFISRKDLV